MPQELPEEQKITGIDRRRVLGWGGALLVTSMLSAGEEQTPGIYAGQLDTLTELVKRYETGEVTPRPLPRLDQLITPDNPRLQPDAELSPVDEAIVIVHPGYLLGEAHKWQAELGGNLRQSTNARAGIHKSYFPEPMAQAEDRHMISTTTGYLRGEQGDYGEYLERLRTLISRAAEAKVPVIMFCEYKDIYSGGTLHPELLPPDNAFIVATQAADAQPTETVSWRNPGEKIAQGPQDMSLLYAMLKRRGVRKILFAGELGINVDTQVTGCLGEAAQNFVYDAQFPVGVMRDVVFPTRPTVQLTPDESFADSSIARIMDAYNTTANAFNSPVPIPDYLR